MANDGGIGAVFVGAHGGKRSLGLFGGNNAYHLAFVGHLEHVVAKHFACAAHDVFYGHAVFDNGHIYAALLGEFVKRRRQAAACGVAEAARVGGGFKHAGNQVVKRCCIGFDFCAERKVFALAHDADAVVAQGAAYQNGVARLAVGAA